MYPWIKLKVSELNGVPSLPMCRCGALRNVTIAAATSALTLLCASGLAAADGEIFACRLTLAVSGQIAKDIIPRARMIFMVTAHPASVTSTRGDRYTDIAISTDAIHFADGHGARYRIIRATGAFLIVPQAGERSYIEGRCKLDRNKNK